jgi:hypothetical protein
MYSNCLQNENDDETPEDDRELENQVNMSLDKLWLEDIQDAN